MLSYLVPLLKKEKKVNYKFNLLLSFILHLLVVSSLGLFVLCFPKEKRVLITLMKM
jgi:hypothetical protein